MFVGAGDGFGIKNEGRWIGNGLIAESKYIEYRIDMLILIGFLAYRLNREL
jgi:hypothetical protein